MMNRIFDTEKNEEFEESFNDIELEDSKEKVRLEKPAFRFPIITDAEIYGWEPDPENERKKADNLITDLDNDGFEPVPLYKNERWPGGNEKPKIHRATAPLKYQNKYEPEREIIPKQAPKKETAVAEDKEESNSAIIRKKSNRPFTPTEVPSPVYGYSRPKVNKVESQSALTKAPAVSGKDLIKNEAEFTSEQTIVEEIHRIDLEEHAHTVDKEKLAYEVEETTLAELAEKEFEPIPRPTAEEELELDLPSNEVIEEKLEPDYTTATSAEEKFEPMESIASLAEEEEIEPIEAMELPVGENLEPAELMELPIEEDFEPTEETELQLESETVPEHREQKKEKIVPFNVLMLKNDKLKYEEREKRITNYSSIDSTTNNIERTDAIKTESRQVSAEIDDAPEEMEEQPYYAFPSKGFLIQPEEHIEDTDWLQSQSEKLEEALSYFAVQANVIEAVQGPTVTRFELTVGHGTKVSKVRNLTDDLKLALAAEDIRIQAPIPGTSSIGIEIPNRKPRAVRISEVIETKRFQDSESPLEAVLGLSLTGEPVTLDLRKMPHGMIAGATGSGKSVCINSILISLLYKASPADLKMLLIDPKMVELAPFNGIPHLLSPVITDVKAATAALKWAVGEMERRYELFAHVGARNIERYNEMAEKDRKFSLKLPYLLIVIDELADLMMMAPADVEVSISRITQKARACGIHLIIATQRPSVDVITGTIKANVPTRIAFSVSSQIDSRTIIDTPGAERLLGKGDMLYLGNGQSSAVRLQGTFVTDAEIERIIEHVQNEAEPDYLFGQEDLLANTMEEEESDPLFANACMFIIEQGSASTSLLQRNFSIGYNRAAKLMDRMEKLGFISEQRGSKAREVYLTESELNHFLNGNEKTV